jgi:hypothetical protein
LENPQAPSDKGGQAPREKEAEVEVIKAALGMKAMVLDEDDQQAEGDKEAGRWRRAGRTVG